MKRILKVSGVLAVLVIILSFVGCSSPEGQKLANAIIKNADVQTVTSDTKTAFKVNLTGVDVPQENQQVLGMINNVSISAITKSDVENNKTASVATVNLFGMKVAEGNLYTNDNKTWLKLPDNPKYIEISPSVNENQGSKSALSDTQMLQIQKEAKDLTVKFLKNFSGEYNFAFSNLKSKGTKVVKTPEGNKNVSLIQLKIDNNELPRLIDYSVKNASVSNSLKEYFKSMLAMASKVQADKEESIVDAQKEIENAFDELESNNNSKEAINELSKYVEVGKDGIDLTYGIDDQGNIVSTDNKLDFIIKDPEKPRQKVEIELIINSVAYNVNRTIVNLPQFTIDNTVKFEDYLSNSPLLEALPFGNPLVPDVTNTADSKEISLIIGQNTAMVGANSVEMDIEPYIEGEYTMVPVKFIGDALGAQVEWDGDINQVSYFDGNRRVILDIGSNIALVNGEPVQIPVAPIIKNGRTMVPVRFVSEQLGAHVRWNDELQMVNIYK